MVRAEELASLSHDGIIALEQLDDGSMIIADVDTVVRAINEDWEGKWQDYIACWKANGWFVPPANWGSDNRE